MKVSLTKFYQEITGASTANRSVTEAAMQRWNVPYEISEGSKGDAVDVVYLEPARKAYAAERAESDARRGPRTSNGSGGDCEALDRNTKALRDVEAAMMLLVEHLAVLASKEQA
jgi:hypothetical protein